MGRGVRRKRRGERAGRPRGETRITRMMTACGRNSSLNRKEKLGEEKLSPVAEEAWGGA